MTAQIIQKLKDLGFETLSEDHFRRIDVWKQWYSGCVPSFHNYKIYNGIHHVACHKVSASLAKKVCEDWADRLFTDETDITLEGVPEQKFFDLFCEKTDFWQKMNGFLELTFALGSGACVLRMNGVSLDRNQEIARGGDLCMDFVSADGIFPLSWENGTIRECAFTTECSRGDADYCYLQLHLQGGDGIYIIQNHLYRKENETLTEVDLNSVPGFESVAEEFRTGSEKALFVIFRPNVSNNLDMGDPLGISVFANGIDQLIACDNVFDSLNSEFLLGRKRIMVKPEGVKNVDGTPFMDLNETAFYALPEGSGNETIIQEMQATLRVQEHLTGMELTTNMLSVKTGFSPGHWKLDQQSLHLHTATEVISTNSAEYRTLKKHQILLEKELIELVRVILKVGSEIYGLGLSEDVEISIDFDDSIVKDTNTEFERDLKMLDAGILAPEEFRAKWMNEDAETAKKAIAEIKKGVKDKDDR